MSCDVKATMQVSGDARVYKLVLQGSNVVSNIKHKGQLNLYNTHTHTLFSVPHLFIQS